ncbi:hypothetical protein JGU66_30785 [Myxococcaceae bacterium JPH2]|nr:hypothetical protein [Myxococcaceae bacterium JPH2]
MPLSPLLREVLGCPRCKGALEVRDSEAGTQVHCPSCQRAWPVEDGIPQMVPERERPSPE